MATVNANAAPSTTDRIETIGAGMPEPRLFQVETLTPKQPGLLRRLWPFGKREKEPPRTSIPESLEIYLQTAFRGNGTATFDLHDVEDIRARSQYGPLVIKGYLLLVALQTLGPLVLWTALTWGQPSSFSGGLRDLEDFVVTVSAGLTGISGLAGFVIGRYFRERSDGE